MRLERKWGNCLHTHARTLLLLCWPSSFCFIVVTHWELIRIKCIGTLRRTCGVFVTLCLPAARIEERGIDAWLLVSAFVGWAGHQHPTFGVTHNNLSSFWRRGTAAVLQRNLCARRCRWAWSCVVYFESIRNFRFAWWFPSEMSQLLIRNSGSKYILSGTFIFNRQELTWLFWDSKRPSIF